MTGANLVEKIQIKKVSIFPKIGGAGAFHWQPAKQRVSHKRF